MLVKLNENGWNIKEGYIEDVLQDKSTNYEALVKLLKNIDFKECGKSCLPSDVGKGKLSHVSNSDPPLHPARGVDLQLSSVCCFAEIKLPLILQVTNVRNVSAPKANEESGAAPRMLRITLTDGTNYINGLEVSFIKSLSLKTPPGTKLKLHSKIEVAGGHLLLDPSNVEVLGGVVAELFEKWKLSQSVSKYSRTVITSDGSGPPPWVPFGQKITVEKERDFKALSDPSVKKKEDDDFEHQRQKTVEELSKESSQKVFGGGKQMLDSNVQKIVNSGGFTIEEAEWALRKNKNDVHRAIQELRRMYMGGGVEEFPAKGFRDPPEDKGRSRGRRGRAGRGRGSGGPDGSDDEMPQIGITRPSKPASLLDYLETRILDKTGDSHSPSNFEERGETVRYGRGGRRGRSNARQKSQFTNNEPSLAAENWPSLGKETESKDTQPHGSLAAAAAAPSSYSRDETHQKYPKNVKYHQEYNSSPRYNQYNDYRDSHQSYYKEKQNYHYDQNQQYSSYRRERDQYRQTDYYEPSQRNESYRYEEKGTYRPRKMEQGYPRRSSGRNMRRGGGGGRSNSSSGGDYARGKNNYYNNTTMYHKPEEGNKVDYYSSDRNTQNYSGGTNFTNKVLSEKDRDLIADFEKSMVMSGLYETPTYNYSQNRNNYSGGNNAGYSSNYNQQFSGSYEYYRGNDSSGRRSRGGGGRRARY